MSWHEFAEIECNKPYFKNIITQVENERSKHEVYPLSGDVFRAFELVEPENVKVVILGQDPYPGFEVHNGQEIPYAMGLSFSVHPQLNLPKSLINIFQELKDDLGIDKANGDLSEWCRQGVFLLNTFLTVRKGQPLSHNYIAWDEFTHNVLSYLLEKNPNIIFVLWGKKAENSVNDLPIKYKIVSSHPSPLSAYRGFLGSRPFSRINRMLEDLGESRINW